MKFSGGLTFVFGAFISISASSFLNAFTPGIDVSHVTGACGSNKVTATSGTSHCSCSEDNIYIKAESGTGTETTYNCSNKQSCAYTVTEGSCGGSWFVPS